MILFSNIFQNVKPLLFLMFNIILGVFINVLCQMNFKIILIS